MESPAPLSWLLQFGGLVQAINGADVDPSGRTDLLRVLDRAMVDGRLASAGTNAQEAQLLCDCDGIRVGYVHEPPAHILALKVGDVCCSSPDLFDLIVLYAYNEKTAEQICQHLAQCFQFVYREAISALEEDGERQHNNNEKFIPMLASSPSSTGSVPASPFPDRLDHSEEQQRLPANSVSTSSNSTKQAVELVNEYLTMLSACLSHDELNKFAILMRRWRAHEMPILEFAQKLLELYGPERRHLLARMRTLLRGDPLELEQLADFLQANGVVENAAVLAWSPLTAEMSLGEGTAASGGSTGGTAAQGSASHPPSAPLRPPHPPASVLPFAHRRPNSS